MKWMDDFISALPVIGTKLNMSAVIYNKLLQS